MKKNDIEEYFPQQKSGDTKNFIISLSLVISLLLLGFYFVSKVEILPEPIQEKITTIKTTFSINQEKKKQEVKPQKPIDLGEKPKVAKTAEVLPETNVSPQKNEERKVFGLQKVFSTGLGAGGSMSDAVVGKFGNTVNKDFDTVTATDAELKAKTAASSSITQAPAFKKRVIPEITDEIRKSGVNGTIRVRVLVDIDGKVKKAVAQNDLGFGTLQSAIAACLQMEFTPAKVGDELVSVWITVPVRFEKL